MVQDQRKTSELESDIKAFIDRLIVRAATIDERLSAEYEPTQCQKTDANAAAHRLASWCISSANGDWQLFAKRLARDGLSFEAVLRRFASIRRSHSAPLPQWAADALWIVGAIAKPPSPAFLERLHSVGAPIAFEHLIASVVEAAERRLVTETADGIFHVLTGRALAELCHVLARDISDLSAPALFELFVNFQSEKPDRAPADEGRETLINAASRYDRFVSEMRGSGLKALFESKPILLRLISVITRQWLQTTAEVLLRLNVDLPSIRESFFCCLSPASDLAQVDKIDDRLSDRHNSGRSVKVLHFTDGTRIVYKPKDLRLDDVWRRLVDRLNAAEPPLDLKTVRVLPKDGYGWAEFMEHTDCADPADFDTFFRRAGAWLCLFHVFAGTDMHEENLIAVGDQPVPIDLEMLLQGLPPSDMHLHPEMKSAAVAGERIIESVTMTGILPTYWRTPENTVVGVGGLSGVHLAYPEIRWDNINSDSMRPVRESTRNTVTKNLPTYGGRQARLGDYVHSLISGFKAYADFLCEQRNTAVGASLFDEFTALPTRRVLRNTRFYYLLLERLRDIRNLSDGVEWSAHLDFMTRFSDWDQPVDSLWPVLASERSALAELCVPHFVTPTDGPEIADIRQVLVANAARSGLARARARYAALDREELSWQVDVIRLSTAALERSDANTRDAPQDRFAQKPVRPVALDDRDPSLYLRVSSDIVRYLSMVAVRNGPGASWIGLDWLGHSGIARPTALGHDLYSGVSGISLFLAAHSKVTGDEEAHLLAIAGLSALRHNLRGANGPRFARALGVGGATGLGSVIYALATIGELLSDKELVAEALGVASLLAEDLLGSDWALDVFDGTAGCILGLMKLYEITRSQEVLDLAVKCGDHLLSRPRHGTTGCRSWLGLAVAEHAPTGLTRPLNGMSHGAAGFAYALGVLGKASSRNVFTSAAEECITFENQTYSSAKSNWPDFRLRGTETEPAWVCQWCHGAGGIGLARIGSLRRTNLDKTALLNDIHQAIRCAQEAWPYSGDNLCCGNLGNIELLTEAGRALAMPHLADEASRRMTAIIVAASAHGEYLFDGVDRRFALGLFRGLAGIGFTCLRQISPLVPSVLIWE